MKYVVVTGGVISGLGKGVTASSVGLLFKKLGFITTMIKIDPYLNVDAGLMSPYEHGEVYVLNDGSETDLDLGNYERFLDIELTNKHNITSGKVFQSVINDERAGKYLGQTVQIIPHVTNKIKQLIEEAAIIPVDKSKKTPEICIIELGGTIGDIESMHFIEALRQLKFNNENDSFCFIHVSLVSKMSVTNETKTKPTQNSVKELRQLGISPDIMVVRSEGNIEESIRKKLSMFCQVPQSNIIVNPDFPTIYHVPLIFHQQNIESLIANTLSLELRGVNVELINVIKFTNFYNSKITKKITIGIIGKYTGLTDSYLSLLRAIEHAAFHNNCFADIVWIASEGLSDENSNEWKRIQDCNGIIIPGGFGARGVEEMIKAATYTLNNNIPTLGICLGFQAMNLAIARLGGATSDSYKITSEEFISEEDKKNCEWGERILFQRGNMKLGALEPRVRDIVGFVDGEPIVDKSGYNRKTERYRHRYHLISETCGSDAAVALQLGYDKIKEFQCNLGYWVGVQFHPEFQTSLDEPHSLFTELIRVSIDL